MGWVSVLLGNSDGTFQPEQIYDAGTMHTYIAIGDVDVDGDLDLIPLRASGTGRGIAVLLGNGDGTFQTPLSSGFFNLSGLFAIGDLNGDGVLDAAVGAGGSEPDIAILLGNGNRTFSGEAPVGTSFLTLALGDMDGDGNLDFVNGNLFSGTSGVTGSVHIWLNQ